MPAFYDRTYINLGADPLHFGHVVHSKATYTTKTGPIRIVYKENKNGDPELSKFEVAFGELARLFLPENLTPGQNLVRNAAQEVVGVASEYMGYAIARREGIDKTFFAMKVEDSDLQLKRVTGSAEDIPFYFLQQFPAGTINKLMKMANAGLLTLDMASIANVLAASYSLEEDDLHKGNFGFYLVEKEGKPHVVFFKIDHDLMLADSVMSRYQSRFLNWFNSTDAFKITQRDLLNFPSLIDSQNYYWPTVKRIFGLDDRVAYNAEERMAFASLADSNEFRQLKWQAFYRHVLTPPSLIKDSLTKHLDMNKPEERAKIALITQSVVARQAKLRAVLFSTPEFRNYVSGMSKNAQNSMISSIGHLAPASEKNWIMNSVATDIGHHQKLCGPNGFVEGDTPLHTAIRLQDYRYHETWDAFGSFSKEKNALGQTPLDLAAVLWQQERTDTVDVRADTLSTMKHLLQQGVLPSKIYKRTKVDMIVYDHDFISTSNYALHVNKINKFTELKNLIRDIGEDHRYSLKMQKEISLSCLRLFTESHKKNYNLSSILQQFKDSLNGTSETPPNPELQFIRQLRSELWIIRIIRGLFGGTATQVAMNKTIDNALQAASSNKGYGIFSFFYGTPEINSPPKAFYEAHQPKPTKVF